MANDVDIIVGVKDLATTVLNRLSTKVNSIGDSSKLAFAGAAERLNDQLAKASSGASAAASAAGSEKLAKAIEQAANNVSTKLDAALAKTNSTIDSITGRIQGVIASISGFVAKAASIATVGAAFITVARGVQNAHGRIAELALGNNLADQSNKKLQSSVKGVSDQFKGMISSSSVAEQSTQKLRVGVLSSLAPFAKYAVAAGAATTLAKSTLQAASASSSLATKAAAVTRGALAAFVLRNALKKTEEGASTLGAKLAKVAAFALAADVAARATLRFGLSLVGLGKKSADSTAALLKTANAGNSLAATASKITAVPFNAVKNGASAAAAATINLSSKIEDLPKGADSVNSLVTSFGNFAAQIGGIPGLLIAIPAGIAGVALAAFNAASKTERQLTQLTNKLGIIQAAKLNVKLNDIDARPLRRIASQTELVAKQIQTATNVQSSKLISLATSSLSKGLDPGKIGEALKAAVGLAEVYGTSIEDGMYKARQAMEGNFESFEKLIPSLKTMTKDSDKLAAVSRLAANGFQVMAMESNTFWGTIEKVKNGLGNTLESLGRMRSLSDLVATVLRDVVTPAVIFLDSKLKGFGFDGRKVLEQAKTIGAGVIAALDIVGSNWVNMINRMETASELFWRQLASNAENFGNNVMPWLAKTMTAAFEHSLAQMSQKQRAQAAILYSGALELFGRVPAGRTQAISEIAKVNKDFYPTTPFPKIPDRKIGPEERSLQKKLDSIDISIGKAFQESFSKARDGLTKVMNDQANVFGINLQTSAAAPSIAAKKDANAFDATLQAVNSRTLTRGPSDDPNKQIAASTAQAAAELKMIRMQQEKMARDAPRKVTYKVMSI